MIGQNQDRAQRARLLLMSQMLDEPCFNTLRTQEQLGYIVGSGMMVMNTVQGFRILIQSEKSCDFLEKRIDNFLINFEKELEEMSEGDFEKHKIGLINKRLEKLKNLSEESGRLWHHVASEAFDFDLVYRDVEHIEPLTKDDLQQFFRSYFHPASETRAKAAVHLIAQGKAVASNDNVKKLTTALSQALTQLGGTKVDEDDLSSRLSKLDLSAGADSQGILGAVTSYLSESAGLAEEQVKSWAEQGEGLLKQILPSLNLTSAAAAAAPEKEEVAEEKEGKTVLIKDVRAWKASLPASQGPRMVRDLTEFEDFEAKL